MLVSQTPVLLVRAHGKLCAFTLDSVLETMRPLPVLPVADAPPSVLGLCTLRGKATPVVDLSRLLGDDGAFVGIRFIALGAEEQPVALAVEQVVGIQELRNRTLEGLPSVSTLLPQLMRLGPAEPVLAKIFRTARVVPERLWHGFYGDGEAPAPLALASNG